MLPDDESQPWPKVEAPVPPIAHTQCSRDVCREINERGRGTAPGGCFQETGESAIERLEVKRLVEDAVAEKKFVVVADVPVARVNENRGNVDSVVVVAVKWLATGFAEDHRELCVR